MPAQRDDATADPRPPTAIFAGAVRFWFWLGCVSFGGPAGQIAMLHDELVQRRRWISESRFLHALNYCMLLPGPEAQQLATYIGWLLHGVRGGIVAGALFVLPSLVVLIALSWAYMALGQAATATWLYGIRPAVVAVVLFAAWRIGKRVLRQPELWATAALAFVAVFAWQAPFPLIVALAAALGWMLRHRLRADAGHGGKVAVAHSPALIDDDTPVPPHARFSAPRQLALLAAGLALWAAAAGPLWLLRGGHDPLVAMATFFSKAALVTFGGAYAVMPYVFQNAVETYHWLTPTQMLDGLALGETTPGPLIMVVAFIGFVGAWGQSAAVAGACVATFFTFLPSFVFILVGGPWVERTRADFKLAGPLTAITAAVVGTILSLGAFLALHALFPAGHPDFAALLIFAVALVALVRNWLGMIPVILACGAAGAALQWSLH